MAHTSTGTDTPHQGLDLHPGEFRRLAHQAIDLIADHLEGLAYQPCRTPVPDAVRQALMTTPLPEGPSSLDAVLHEARMMVYPYPMGNSSPRFFGWVNSPPAPAAILGELLAAALNPSVAGGDHAAVYLEHGVLRWLRAIVGYPQTSGGLLVSGGSVANLVGLAVMRHVHTAGRSRSIGLGHPDCPTPIVYASAEGHSCIQKAVELLGLGHDSLRRIPVTGDWRMDVDALRRAIADDRALGLVPACVAASAGTVNTGAVDPLDAIADLCAAERLWFHVDAAYGGPAALLPALVDHFRGLDRADSLAMDPHKWMYVPVECGCALVRDAAAMRDTFSLVPPYLRDDTVLPWFSEFGVQQTRGFRALKLWMVLKQVGLEGYRDAIARDLALTRSLRQRLQAQPDFEIVADGPLSVTCFRFRPLPVAGSEDATDQLNRRLLELVQAEGDVFLTSTELLGRFVLRACIVNFRTTELDLVALLDAVRRAGEQVLANR